jgi:hypothetical protein
MLTSEFPCAIVYADNLEKCLALSRSFRRSQLRRPPSEGKVELLTVPLSGRNGRFFLAEFFGLFDSRPASLYQTERQLDTKDLLGSRKPFRAKGEKKWKGTKRKRSWLS